MPRNELVEGCAEYVMHVQRIDKPVRIALDPLAQGACENPNQRRFAFGARKLMSLDLSGRVHRQNPFFGEPGKQHPDRGHMLLDGWR